MLIDGMHGDFMVLMLLKRFLYLGLCFSCEISCCFYAIIILCMNMALHYGLSCFDMN